MNPKLVMAGLLSLFCCADLSWAHGGQYRGPGDTVPPNPGNRGGRTPGPSGPGSPHPGSPMTPGPANPGTPGPGGPGTGGAGGPGPVGGPTTGSMDIPDDLNRWEFWWEFNKDPFLKLKEAIHSGEVVSGDDEFYLGSGTQRLARDSLEPTESQILTTILPKLATALDATEQNDIVSSCMVAMAKVGKNTDQINILDAFRRRLRDRNQEVRETAAIAMGISQMTEAIPDLVELAKDSTAGRKLCARDSVDYRTRSFAIYGLGLIAHATADHSIKSSVFGTLRGILDHEDAPERDIRVAAISAISLIAPNPANEAGRSLLDAALTALDDYWSKDLGPTRQLVQSHVPPAVARLYEAFRVDPGLLDPHFTERLDGFRRSWLAEVQGNAKNRRSSDDIVRSSIIALGRTSRPVELKQAEPRLDMSIAKELETFATNGSDEQARYFALMALAQMGGSEARSFLLDVLRTGKKALERPWAAISLGVLEFRNREARGDAWQPDELLGRELLKQLEVKNPGTRGALAIALGLARYEPAAPALRDMLDREKNQDELPGYICIGLALMADRKAIAPIMDLVQSSARRGDRLRQAAIALGKLGDKHAANSLLKMLDDDGSQPDLAKMSAIAAALGFIGDTSSVDPLVDMLFDKRLTDLSRAFAAVALGGIADKELLPWNSKLAVNMNYRAAVETLTNQSVGVLDIL
ncbi:MAG: hypothetical protein U1F36_07245 [Planctomycetota bacterium]